MIGLIAGAVSLAAAMSGVPGALDVSRGVSELGTLLVGNKKALDVIAAFAERLCNEIPLEGNKLELTGEAKAELGGFIKKLAKLGVEFIG